MRRLPHALLAAALSAACLVTPVRAEWNPEPFNGGTVVTGAPGSQVNPVGAADGAGGAFIAWVESFSTVWMQHVDSDGVPQWGPFGIGVGGTEGSSVALVADGAGGVVALWSETGSLNGHTLRAQRFDVSGAPQWTAGGVTLSGGSQPKLGIRAIPDGTGGAIVTWYSSTLFRGEPSPYIARANRVSGAGVAQWGAAGVQPTAVSTESSEPTIVSDGAGGAIIGWSDTRSSAQRVYAQRYDSAGAAQWTANGVQVCTAATPQWASAMVSDGAGGAVVSWLDYRVTNVDVYAQRLDGSGVRQWTTSGVGLCTQGDWQSGISITTDGAGGAIVSWDDPRGGNIDVYAQRVSAAGAPLWTVNGAAVCSAAGNQYPSRIVSDGAGGAIVAWEDYRNGSGDIYARRIGSNGIPQWTGNGNVVCAAADGQAALAMVETGTGSAILAWHDFRAGGAADIYAQRMDGLGYLGDPAPRITSVHDVPNDEGGYVKVSWNASYIDREPEYAIQHYIVERYVGPGWLLVADHVVGPQPEYSAFVQSAGDSIGPGNAPFSVYRVKAVALSQPLTAFWYSPPDSARSIDNLGPLTPAPFTGTMAAGVARLSWARGHEADLAAYRVYRGSSEDFTPSAATLIAETRATSLEDPAGSPHVYRLTAVDAHGNESPPATWVPEGFDPSAKPRAFSFAMDAPLPNPARQMATFRFTLPRRSPIRLTVLDLGGRAVRILSAEAFEAGEQSVVWDLRDAGGHRVAPGLYFARLSAAGEARTRAVTVLD